VKLTRLRDNWQSVACVLVSHIDIICGCVLTVSGKFGGDVGFGSDDGCSSN
jgi:hypothetical protein